MANKIHNYLIERFTFGDEDFYDIDFFDGVTYQTAKIKGSTIKAGIQAGLVSLNLYNNDDSLTANRTLDGASFGLTFTNLNQFLLKVTGLPSPFGTPAVDYQITPVGGGRYI